MTKLVNKMPFDMRKRWVRESAVIKEKGGRMATFGDFVKYVTRESTKSKIFCLADAYLQARLRVSRQMSRVPANSLKVLNLGLVTVFLIILVIRIKHGFGVGSARMADIGCTIAQNLGNYQCKRNQSL